MPFGGVGGGYAVDYGLCFFVADFCKEENAVSEVFCWVNGWREDMDQKPVH